VTGDLSGHEAAEVTAYVDIDCPPPDDEPVALVLFGTNQSEPTRIAAERYHRGRAPLLIATGGVNRHNGIVEGREFARVLADSGVPTSAVRVEDQSADTWQNVELSLPYLREAITSGLRLAVVSKWYHRRAVMALLTRFPEAGPVYAVGWEPVYADATVTRENWPMIPAGKRRVVREWEEVSRRVGNGTYLPAEKRDGAWQ
jgi:DUF218 domain